MGAICGILGVCDSAVVKVMARALAHRADVRHFVDGPSFALASSTPVGSPAAAVVGCPLDPNGRPLSANDVPKCLLDSRGTSMPAIQGAFAGVFLREEDKRWVLVRDRLGQRPLYYYLAPDYLLFASELKALLASGRVGRHLNLPSVDRYLMLRCVPGRESIIQDVFRVSPGCAAEYNGHSVLEKSFAKFDMTPERLRRQDAAARLRMMLETSLSGASAECMLWSAGMDCAALGALCDSPKPFFVQLERGWQDEARMAKDSARKLGLKLETGTARRMSEETLFHVVRALDEPIADASVLPLWLVLECAGSHAHTFLSGHGADELLGGYSRYHFLQQAHRAHPLVPVTLLSGIQPSLPPNAFVRRWSRYLTSLRDNLERYLALVSVFDHDEREGLYTDAMKASLHEHGDSLAVVRTHFEQGDLTHNLLALDLNVGLPDFLLAKCDRLAAAHGVSLRLPYLNDAVVDSAIRLSPTVKFGVRSKPLLRLAVKDVVPGLIRLRRQRGFHVPQDGRLARILDTVSRRVITQERVDASGIFKWPYVEQVLRSATHNVYRRRQYWALLMFFAWYREFMEA